MLLVRMAAMEAVLEQAPFVGGRFTRAPFVHLAQPFHAELRAVYQAMQELLRLGSRVLS